MQSPAFLTISDLWIERGEKDLCKGFHLNVRKGEIIRILGANGAGKSSLFKAIIGILNPLEGRIEYDGQDVTQEKNALLQETLYIGHTSGLKDALTVEENLRHYFPSASCDAIRLALASLEIEALAESLVNTLSAGQVRRATLARLWLTEKTLWLLDEPFTSLDAQGVERLEAHIQKHTASGGIVMLSTHQALTALQSRDVALIS